MEEALLVRLIEIIYDKRGLNNPKISTASKETIQKEDEDEDHEEKNEENIIQEEEE